jgi:hypothetical protein
VFDKNASGGRNATPAPASQIGCLLNGFHMPWGTELESGPGRWEGSGPYSAWPDFALLLLEAPKLKGDDWVDADKQLAAMVRKSSCFVSSELPPDFRDFSTVLLCYVSSLYPATGLDTVDIMKYISINFMQLPYLKCCPSSTGRWPAITYCT